MKPTRKQPHREDVEGCEVIVFYNLHQLTLDYLTFHARQCDRVHLI